MEPVPFYSGSQSECQKAGHMVVYQDADERIGRVCFTCKLSYLESNCAVWWYCEICDLSYHDACHLFKPEIRHPFHLSHTLSALYKDNVFWSGSSTKGGYGICNCCGSVLGTIYYHCSLCNYSINASCTRDPLHLTITHPKSHEHTLTLFPGRFTFPCKACGKSLEDVKNVVYTCLPCSYMVHKTCIYLPRVIKITRHQHRLSYSSFLPPSEELSCGGCHQTVDINYGQYSCTNGCHYVLHSRCATRDDVWDGIDLEGVSEEPEEDMEPFVRIDEETIQHFSHEHYLKLHLNYIPSGNQYMFCQVCTLPVLPSHSFYSCMQCDFVLDEACACLPRKTHHLLHKHPLFLLPIYPPKPHDLETKGMFQCDGCRRKCCGFVYICIKEKCYYQLDTMCASLPDPFIHDFHLQDHPLFFSLHDHPSFLQHGCMGCKNQFSRLPYVLECIKCKFYLCIPCATIPRVAHYKYDRHPLTLCHGEDDASNLQYWCEICESRLDASKWFYTCDYCRVTLHLTCLLGKDPYMKPSHICTSLGNEIEIALNGNPRPFCDYCARRCIQSLVFKSEDETFCSFDCSSTGSFITMRGKKKL